MTRTEIAIVTPLYATPQNRRLELFSETLGSVSQQDVDYVHVVVDDGSTDDRVAAALNYLADRGRAICVQQPNAGSSAALNVGIKRALAESPDYITVLHSDDLLPIDALATRIRAMRSQQAVFGYTELALFTERVAYCADALGALAPNDLAIYLRSQRGFFPNPSMIWDATFLANGVGGYDVRLLCGEDRDIALRSAQAAVASEQAVAYSPDITALYRIHQQSVTAESIKNGRAAADRVLFEQKHGPVARSSSVYGEFRKAIAKLPEPVKRLLRPVRDGFRSRYDDSWRATLPRTLDEVLT